MKLSENIGARRTVRKFKDGATVTDEQVKLMLEAAMAAPSACNKRPWEFIVVTNKDKLVELADTFPNVKTRTSSIAIIVCALPEIQVGNSEGFFPQDCGAASQNILLQVHDLGLGACWCGFYPKEPRTTQLRQLLELPESVIPINIIAIGEADETPERKGHFDEAKVKYIR